MEFETYPFPPIQEAILDIYATVPDSTNLPRLEEFWKGVEADFPEKRPRYNFSSNIKFNPEDASQNTSSLISKQTGWIFRTPTKDKAIQARLDGFTFNRLPVYEGWGKFSEQARKLWGHYCQFAEPKLVSGISLRYINRLNLPLPLGDFQEYCVLFPQSAPNHPKALDEFLLRYGGPSQSAKGAATVVTVTFQPPDLKAAQLPILIDIQVTQHFTVAMAADNAAVWMAFESLRLEKNLVFEASITDKARALFRK